MNRADDPQEIKASFLSHVHEEGIEYTMTGHGVAHDLAKVDPEFAAILSAYEAAYKAVKAWIELHRAAST